jgi:endonuclease/exonuclease/phosphatase family metal-dependent hydrolase
MKKFLFIVLLTFFHLNTSGQNIRVMSYNLRFDNPGDGVNQWSLRRKNVYELLKKTNPDIWGTQEGLQNQLDDIKQNLPYEYLGAGRDDGKSKGEFSAILYKKEIYKVLDQNTFWLSETPDVPGSKSWDAAITRIVTWAKFQHNKSKAVFYVFNTHFDHIGVQARLKSAELIKQKIKEIAGTYPVILTGDFNSEPADAPYSFLAKDETYLLIDSGNGNTQGTFCTFEVNSQPCRRIDYIFHSPSIKSEGYTVVTDNNGHYYPSDHLPVLTTLQMK